VAGRRGLRGGAGDEVEDAMSDIMHANATAMVNLDAPRFTSVHADGDEGEHNDVPSNGDN
jgi:hypothetical protein